MAIEVRPVRTDDDVRRMQALAVAFPQHTVHVTDLPYRLASPALHDDPARDTALWVDGADLVAWAVWQSPWGKFDYAIRPADVAGLAPEVVRWGEARARALARERNVPGVCAVSSRDDDPDRVVLLERAGYRRAEWTAVRQERALTEALPTPELPDGFRARPLHRESEVEAYVAAHRAAFGSVRMTSAWRRRILTMPEYRPDLDLVVEAPDGRIAAFTILWLTPYPGGRVEAQFEPVGTHPAFQRRGLARALLLHAMRQAADASATHTVVEADGMRTPARTLYESLMPSRGYAIVHYAKSL